MRKEKVWENNELFGNIQISTNVYLKSCWEILIFYDTRWTRKTISMYQMGKGAINDGFTNGKLYEDTYKRAVISEGQV